MSLHPTEPVPSELSPLLDTPQETMAVLSDRLADLAEQHQLLDVGYRTVDSPLGTLLLAATSRGLVRVAYAREGFDAVLARLAETVSPRVLRASKLLDTPASQLDEYFAGRRRTFQLPLDLQLTRGFRRTVLDHLIEIGFGRTESYTQVAAATGRPAAVRAVGTACATNPLPIVVPCHRVLRSDGSLGGYLGGLDAKQTLLQLEAA